MHQQPESGFLGGKLLCISTSLVLPLFFGPEVFLIGVSIWVVLKGGRLKAIFMTLTQLDQRKGVSYFC